MSLESYRYITEQIEVKKKKMTELGKDVNELEGQLLAMRRKINLDEAVVLKEKCDDLFEKKKDKRIGFVFLFVLIYGARYKGSMPHRMAFLLSIILKKMRDSISRDWADAVKRVESDSAFRENVNIILDDYGL